MHRFFRPPQIIGHLVIFRQQPFLPVQQEKDHIRLAHGLHGLLTDQTRHHFPAVALNASGVNEDKNLLLYGYLFIMTVAGYAWGGVNNGLAALGESIEKAGFADIGPANQGYDGISGLHER
jgi:hypothetical protein